MKRPVVYILTNKRNGTLYTGVAGDLARRLWQHQHGDGSSFVREHKLFVLVYFEVHDTIYEAIRREKQVKRWRRSWKLKLIEDINPMWDDLTDIVMHG